MKALLPILLLLSFMSFAQQSAVFRIDSLPEQGILIDKGWKFHAGDNPEWAKPNFDDRDWQSINPTADIRDSLPQLSKQGISWLRLHLSLDRRPYKTTTGADDYANWRFRNLRQWQIAPAIWRYKF